MTEEKQSSENIVQPQGETQNTEENTPLLLELYRTFPINSIALLISIIIFILMVISELSFFSFDLPSLIKWGGAFNINIYEGEYWRLITSAFVHDGILHIGMNILFILITYSIVAESIFKPYDYLIFLFVVIFVSSVFSFYFNSHHPYCSVGFSGAILGMWATIYMQDIFSGNKETRTGSLKWWFLLFTFFVIVGSGDNTDVFGHLFGFIAGAVLAAPYTFLKNIAKQQTLASFIHILLSVILVMISSNYLLKAPKDVFIYNRKIDEVILEINSLKKNWEILDTISNDNEKRYMAFEQLQRYDYLLSELKVLSQLKLHKSLMGYIDKINLASEEDRNYFRKIYLPSVDETPLTQEQIAHFFEQRDSLIEKINKYFDEYE